MARKKILTEEQIIEGKTMRGHGWKWADIAEHFKVSKDTVMYHCSPGRREQVQSAVRKYQEKNYDTMRRKQREYYATHLKIQQEET